MTSEENIEIYINKKKMLYSHQNMVRTINSFFPYLTNEDLDEMSEYITTLKEHRKEKEAESVIEVAKHSWPYPDIAPIKK